MFIHLLNKLSYLGASCLIEYSWKPRLAAAAVPVVVVVVVVPVVVVVVVSVAELGCKTQQKLAESLLYNSIDACS